MGGGNEGSFDVLTLQPRSDLNACVSQLPASLPATPMMRETPMRTRDFTLDMHLGGMMSSMFRGLLGGPTMSINTEGFDMDTINHQVQLGDTELWRITANTMMHPFQVHGTSFQVVARNGNTVDPATVGWKDVVLVNGSAEILVRFDKPADATAPLCIIAIS